MGCKFIFSFAVTGITSSLGNGRFCDSPEQAMFAVRLCLNRCLITRLKINVLLVAVSQDLCDMTQLQTVTPAAYPPGSDALPRARRPHLHTDPGAVSERPNL